MTCQLCDREFHNSCCDCGWKPGIASDKASFAILLQRCSESGCDVTIRVRAGRQEPYPLCKWHREGKAYYDPEQQTVALAQSAHPKKAAKARSEAR